LIDSKERAKRFIEARTVHNQHGKQTLTQVRVATGVQESMISDLETSVYKEGKKERPVQYQKIVTLSEHYGVNVAWLMGQPNASYKLDEDVQTVVRTTGLSDAAVNVLQTIKGTDLNGTLNRLIESEYFADMLFQFSNAMKINSANTQTDEVAEVIENLQVWGIANGMDSKNSRLSNRQLVDLYRRKAIESINKAFTLIIKEDKNNGERNEENK